MSWIWPLYLHVNQKSDDEDDMQNLKKFREQILKLSIGNGVNGRTPEGIS